MASGGGNLPTSIVAVILTKCEHSNGLKILKSICHRQVFSDIFDELHPKSTTSELTWTVEVNGYLVDKPSHISLGDLLHVLTPPVTVTYKCTPHTENVSLLEAYTIQGTQCFPDDHVIKEGISFP